MDSARLNSWQVEAHLPARDHASTAPLYYLDIQPLVVSQVREWCVCV